MECRYQELAGRLSKNAKLLPTLAAGSEEARQVLERIRNDSYEMHTHSTAADEWIRQYLNYPTDVGVFVSLIKLGVLTAIPKDGGISYGELAELVGAKEDVLARLCRFAAAKGLLQESVPGTIAHNEKSLYVEKRQKLIAAFLVWVGEDFPVDSLSDALAEDPTASDPGKTAFTMLWKRRSGKPTTVWEFFASNPPVQALFTEMMETGLIDGGVDDEWLRSSFHWGGLAAGSTVVDVGGNQGHVAYALAKTFPHLRYIVQDRQEVVDLVKSKGGDTAGPVSFQVHDMFSPQTVQAEVYFFRKIFHDWSDEYCTKIISALAPALKRGARVLINNEVLPAATGGPDYAGYMAKRQDINMMFMLNGKERSVAQWEELVGGAVAGLKLDKVTGTGSSAFSLLEFRYE